MAYTDREDLNYLGVLYEIGANQTPLLTMMGGLAGGNFKTSTSLQFPCAQPYSIGSASQPDTTEAASVTSNTATTVTRGQDLNTAQLFQYTVEVSDMKQATYGNIGGLSAVGDQPVKDEFAFQKQAQLRKMAIDLEYTFINGAYTAETTSDASIQTRGLVEAITTNTTDANAAQLTKALLDGVFAKMFAAGAPFDNVVILCNSYQKTKISGIYGYAPTDRNIGGVNIKQIETDYGNMAIRLNPHVATDDVLIVEMSVVAPVYVPVDGQLIRFKEIAPVAASKKGEWYALIGLDYGPEEYHGSLTNLATSA